MQRRSTRRAKDSELIQYATEIKVRAERRCGEMLANPEKHAGGRPSQNQSNDSTGSVQTLAEMGITKDECSRYQQLAAMPVEHGTETTKAAASMHSLSVHKSRPLLHSTVLPSEMEVRLPPGMRGGTFARRNPAPVHSFRRRYGIQGRRNV